LVDAFFSNRPLRGLQFEESMEVNVTTGTVKRVISERGFGFIAGEDGKEYFFHRDGLAPSVDFDRLVGGESVSFEVETGPKGDRAVQVQSA
jgi:CspA family cold shock protein